MKKVFFILVSILILTASLYTLTFKTSASYNLSVDTVQDVTLHEAVVNLNNKTVKVNHNNKLILCKDPVIGIESFTLEEKTNILNMKSYKVISTVEKN